LFSFVILHEPTGPLMPTVPEKMSWFGG